jgi:hypothetical protein
LALRLQRSAGQQAQFGIGLAAHAASGGSFARQNARQMSVFAGMVSRLSTASPNPSIERTAQKPLRAFWSSAHVER